MCDCAEINKNLGFDLFDDVWSFSSRLIELNYGEEYLVCKEIISNWKEKLNDTYDTNEKNKMMKEVYDCVQSRKSEPKKYIKYHR